MFDEVQTGFGRTGRPFAAETFGVAPDVVLFAKGVASGLPLAGIMAGAELMDRWPNGTHGSTFGGNPVACAAAVATIEVLEARGPLRPGQRPRRSGARRTCAASGHPWSSRSAASGAMIGVELTDKATAEAVQQRCLDDGVIVLTCGPDGNVLRLIPPLTMTDDELDHGLAVLGHGAGRLALAPSPQRLLVDLAGADLGELVEDHDGPRRLEGGQAARAPTR